MKNFKKITLFLVLLVVTMLSFVSCGNANGQTPDYSIYKGAYYLKDGDKINQEVWFYINADGTWQNNVANCGTFTVDDTQDDNIRFEGDLTLIGKIRARYLKIRNQDQVIEYEKGAGTPVPPAEYMCARHGHDLKSFEAQNPTCTEEGCAEYNACIRAGCGYSTRVAIAPLGHEFVNEKCVRCGENAPMQEEIARSEKIKDEIKNDVPDKNPQDIIIPIVPTKEDGATDEQIAIAQQQADEAIEEKSYWTIVEIVKNWYAENYAKSKEYPNSYVRKIESVKQDSAGWSFFIDIEIISIDVSGIYRKHCMLLEIDVGDTPENYNRASDILAFLERRRNIVMRLALDDTNTEFATDLFNCVQNSEGGNVLLASKTILDENGNLNKVRLKVERADRTFYVEYSVASFVKVLGNDKLIEMAKSGELAKYSISTPFYQSCYKFDYDWENANNKYWKN